MTFCCNTLRKFTACYSLLFLPSAKYQSDYPHAVSWSSYTTTGIAEYNVVVISRSTLLIRAGVATTDIGYASTYSLHSLNCSPARLQFFEPSPREQR